MWLLSELIAYCFILERPLSDLLASRLLWFSETGTRRIPEGFFRIAPCCPRGGAASAHGLFPGTVQHRGLWHLKGIDCVKGA